MWKFLQRIFGSGEEWHLYEMPPAKAPVLIDGSINRETVLMRRRVGALYQYRPMSAYELDDYLADVA